MEKKEMICEACGKPVVDGFAVNSDTYYCSIACLKTRYTEAQWAGMYSIEPGEDAEIQEDAV